jgi:hypothetical protein
LQVQNAMHAFVFNTVESQRRDGAPGRAAMTNLLVSSVTFPNLQHGPKLRGDRSIDPFTVPQVLMIVVERWTHLETQLAVRAVFISDDWANTFVYCVDKTDLPLRTDVAARPATKTEPPVDHALHGSDRVT